MAYDVLALVNPGIRKLQPYQPGKPIEMLQRELGVQDVIKLASNENPLGYSKNVAVVLSKDMQKLHRYPDGSGYSFKRKLSKQLGLESSQITLGNGSDQLFSLVLRTFVQPEHEVIVSQYAFIAYAVATSVVGAKLVTVPAKQWGHDLAAMAAAVTEKTRVIFIANMNNPTGTWNTRQALELFLKEIPQNVIVVIDQAYYEYMNMPEYPDVVEWLPDYPNLIVTRTFSKAYGLAGLRVGYAMSSVAIADVLNRVRLPFNVSVLALAGAEVALLDQEHIEKTVAITDAGLQQLSEGFDKLGLSYITKTGNFITVDFGVGAQNTYQQLLREGIIVRPLIPYGMQDHLRISVGLNYENERLLMTLEKIRRKNG